MSTECPAQTEGLDAYEVDDGLVVYQTTADRVHYLNASATVVFELCNGTHTDDEIVELVRAAWGLAEPPREEVLACLAELRAEGVVR